MQNTFGEELLEVTLHKRDPFKGSYICIHTYTNIYTYVWIYISIFIHIKIKTSLSKTTCFWKIWENPPIQPDTPSSYWELPYWVWRVPMWYHLRKHHIEKNTEWHSIKRIKNSNIIFYSDCALTYLWLYDSPWSSSCWHAQLCIEDWWIIFLHRERPQPRFQ